MFTILQDQWIESIEILAAQSAETLEQLGIPAASAPALISAAQHQLCTYLFCVTPPKAVFAPAGPQVEPSSSSTYCCGVHKGVKDVGEGSTGTITAKPEADAALTTIACELEIRCIAIFVLLCAFAMCSSSMWTAMLNNISFCPHN